MAKPKRDPRINPQVGDWLGSTVRPIPDRHVVDVVGMLVWYRLEDRPRKYRCGLAFWQDWCRKNQVMVVGEGE